MNVVNKVQLTGNLGAKPEIKTFDGGNKLARFSMATSEEFTTKKGEKVTETQWHSIAVWGKLADMIESQLDKGSYVSVEGKLVHRNYLDKNGVKKYITEVVASDVLVKQKAD
ncbi:MAG TPA: single-stranded DNA-binding protein [Bacteroidia bacterium]|nr:single-stranded DNA-binding protein [Bacteroidia bacterium]